MKYLKHPALWFSLYMGLLGGSYLPYHMALPVRVSYHVLLTGLLIWWVWRDGLPSTPLLLPMGLTGAVTFISALNAIDPRIALENWWHFFVNGLLMLMLVSWLRKGWGETLFKAHFGVGVAIIGFSALEWFLAPVQRVGGAFGLINLTGAYAAALLLPAFVWAWMEKRAWLFAIGFGLVGVLLANASRGAFISAGVACITFLLLRYRVRLPMLVAVWGITVAVGLGVLNLSNRAEHATGDVLRADLWRSALVMVKDHPLTGVGPGLFGQAYRVYRAGTADNATGAHSIYLNALAELGVPGALASGLTALVFLRSIARRRTPKQDAILAALVGIAVHLAFDNFPATNFVVLINLYVAYLVSHQEPGRIKNPMRLATARALTVVLMVYGASLLLMDDAQFFYERSLRENSLHDAQVAAYIDPANRLYKIHLAWMKGDTTQVHQLDPTLSPATDLGVYGIINFGRYFS